VELLGAGVGLPLEVVDPPGEGVGLSSGGFELLGGFEELDSRVVGLSSGAFDVVPGSLDVDSGALEVESGGLEVESGAFDVSSGDFDGDSTSYEVSTNTFSDTAYVGITESVKIVGVVEMYIVSTS
jgi:hypothetical protein